MERAERRSLAAHRRRKRFELRKNDRDFTVGDTLRLREWDPDTEEYSGREWRGVVTYIAAPWDGSWLQPGYVAMSIRPLAGSPDDERKYPCDRCGKLRTKAEGGTTFTVCDECWNETMGGSPDDGDVLSRSEYLRTLERLAAHAEHPNMILAPLRAARAHDARLRQRLRDAEPSVLQNDVRDLLEAVGLEDYARTVSPHRVVQDEVIPAIRRLREALRRVAYDGYIAPSPAEIARRAYEGERR